jgi:hypothetical protein
MDSGRRGADTLCCHNFEKVGTLREEEHTLGKDTEVPKNHTT